LIALAARISSDSAFLAKKDDLRARLTMINNVAARKSAEALERTAAASKAPADFAKAADAYFQLFKQMRNAKPPGDGADEVLYNAGVAYESASDMRRAVECYRLLLREQPASKMHGRAMRQLGAALGTLAMPSEAADALEMYATRYGAERDAVDALADAFTYRRAAGDDAKAIATAQKLINMFSFKRRNDAAAAQLAIADIHQRRGDKPAALKSLRAYLTQFGSRGDAGKDITVQRNIGELEWALSCPVATVDGLCMQLSKVKAPLTCASRKPVALGEAGVPARPRYQMVKRKAEHVKAAMAAFSAAQQLAQRLDTISRVVPSDAPRSTPLFNTPDDTPKPYDIATAQRMLAEPEFEAFWALQFPRNLNFDPAQPKVAAAAQKVFTAWLTESTQRSTALRTKYQQVLSLKDPANTFAGMARLGQLADKFSYELTNGDIPASLRAGEFGEEKVTAYCDTMQEQAAALTDGAEQAYAACVAKATELAWRDASTDVCQRELTRLNPKAAPPHTERRGPAVPSAVTSPEGAAVPGSGANERTLGAGR
jgi:tetratricopeptide (TPR) repeat protein